VRNEPEIEIRRIVTNKDNDKLQKIGLYLSQRFPNVYTLRPPEDFALIYAPPGKKRKILYLEHK
jgi:hypothetical protein